MEAIRISLGDGVFLTCLPADKFKTGVLSAQFVTPMGRDTASAYALIPSVLRRGTVSCPDMGALEEKLDRLYGARIDATVRKIGERQCVGFVASMVDDRFVPGGELLLEPVAELLGELICNPVTELASRFVPAYFESEQANLLDAIRSQMNDKREWAARRLLEEMCAREPYGIPRLGDERHVEKLRPKSLFNRYRKLIASARLELVYCGSAEPSRVEDALRRAFAALPRETGIDLAPAVPHAPRKTIRKVTDAMDVTQGKLSMGFSCTSDDFPALVLGNSIFGGSSNSKLFLNVREKLSLCYYASSVYHRQKRLLTVASGIEFANYEKA
ncbi:MAG: insulinase family protein, partial [Oscillibacter sp.]|nr:insulinase family protein [Oscillibacter sp.]